MNERNNGKYQRAKKSILKTGERDGYAEWALRRVTNGHRHIEEGSALQCRENVVGQVKGLIKSRKRSVPDSPDQKRKTPEGGLSR